jgi:hypothetical protein
MRHTLVLTLALLAACTQKDEKAPPAPRVDPVQSPTSKSKVIVTGSAEFGSTVKIAGGAETVSVTADAFTAFFRAEVTLNTAIPSGSVSLKNTLSVTATDAAGNVSEATTLDVLFGPEPGVPTKLTFALTGAADGGTITAGTDVSYSYTLTDAYDGPVVNPLQVIASAPNTTVFDDGISGNGLILGFTRTGTFNITARATGVAGVSKVVPLTVTPAKGARYVSMGLTLSRMATGDTTAALTIVKDLYNNVIIDDANGMSAGLTLACAPQNTATPATACTKMGNAFTVTRAGVYKITATYDDGSNPVATASSYVFAEDAPDVEPPTAAITGIVYPTGASQVPRNTNSRVEVQIDFTDNKALASAVLYALFGGNPSCISNSGTLLLTGQGHVATNASVRVPACAFPWDTISLFASVVDEAGNQGFSSMNTALSVSGAGMGTVSASSGYTLRVVGVGNNNNNNQSIATGFDVAWDPSAEIAYVPVTSNNGRIAALLPDRTSNSVRDITGTTYFQNGNGVSGIAVSAGGELFQGRPSNGGNTGAISYIPPTLPVAPTSLVSNLSGPTRLVYDNRPATPVVCVAQSGSATQAACYTFNPTAGTLTSTFTGLVPVPAPAGGNTSVTGIAVGAASGASYTFWMLYNGCGLYKTASSFDGSAPATPTAVTVSPSLGNTCGDIAALPSGDVAIISGSSVVRVTPAGASSPIVSNLGNPTGLDFAGGALYVLDTGTQAVIKVTATGTSAF